jgi:hypothetical protein
MLFPHYAENLRYNNAVQQNILCKNTKHIVISGFRLEVNETCAPLGYYATYRGNSLPTFQFNVHLTSEDATDRLFRDMGKELPL